MNTAKTNLVRAKSLRLKRQLEALQINKHTQKNTTKTNCCYIPLHCTTKQNRDQPICFRRIVFSRSQSWFVLKILANRLRKYPLLHPLANRKTPNAVFSVALCLCIQVCVSVCRELTAVKSQSLSLLFLSNRRHHGGRSDPILPDPGVASIDR